MKRVLSFVLVLVVLLQLWACGTGNNSSTQDSEISALQDEVRRLKQENDDLKSQSSKVLESQPTASAIDITTLSENEALAFAGDFLKHSTSFLGKYTDFYDGLDTSLDYLTIAEAEKQWEDTATEEEKKFNQIKGIRFPEKYASGYDEICTMSETFCYVSDRLTNWDINKDGSYTEDEINDMFHECNDRLENLSVDNLKAMFSDETDISNKDTDAYSSASSTSTATMGEKNALKSAKEYLDYTAFSYKGLIDQLEYEGYTHSEAVYGADNCGADWNKQAAKCAADYLDYTSFSRSGLIEQLEYEGFTYDQAVYGVEQNGY